MCLEFLRQLLVDGGYYGQANPDFNVIVGMRYICEMAIPAVSRNDLPMRLKGRMLCFQAIMPSDTVVSSIFHRMIKGKLMRYSAPKNVVNVANAICDLTVDVWHRCRQRFPPVPNKLHYDFSMHDLARVAQGILRVPVASLQTIEGLITLWKWEFQVPAQDPHP